MRKLRIYYNILVVTIKHFTVNSLSCFTLAVIYYFVLQLQLLLNQCC